MKPIYKSDVNIQLKLFTDKSYNTIFCDPPYQLGSTWYICPDSGKYKIKHSSDFMNKWDGLNENDLETFFKESFRVLKYGGYLLMFGLDRQLAPLQYYACMAGFEQHQSLYWYFCSNFPKSVDVSKAIDKKLGLDQEVIRTEIRYNEPSGIVNAGRGADARTLIERRIGKPTSNLAKQFDGYKYSQSPLKQTVETILVFKRSGKNNSIIDDILESESNDKINPSVLNIDGGRVKTDEEIGRNNINNPFSGLFNGIGEGLKQEGLFSGRYPSQTFIDENVAKDVIDRQSGISKSVGGASRINHIIKYEKYDHDLFNYSPKVQKEERNAGLDNRILDTTTDGRNKPIDNAFNRGETERFNIHPTVKPINLVFRIAQLFLLPDECNQKVLVPYCGSGSELIGWLKAGINPDNIQGIEINQEYIDIANDRIKYWYKFFQDEKKIVCKKQQEINNKNNVDQLSLYD